MSNDSLNAQEHTSHQPSRRDILRAAGVIAAGAALGGGGMQPGAARAENPPAVGVERKRVLRVAHLTDLHIMPERRAAEGVAACLKHVMAQPQRPDLLVTGGDLIMDAFDADLERTKLQWSLLTGAFKAGCGVPFEHVFGNHDIWGWNKTKSGTKGDEPLYGKKYVMDAFGLSAWHRSFDRSGWHFILLDSITQNGDGYVGRIDDAQFEWLKADLARTPAATPVVIVSHIPLLSACVYVHCKDEETRKSWHVSGGLMHTDFRRVRDLFLKHPNVKLCLSGHIHQIDRIEYEGVTYICDGAVSGAWWKGKHFGCSEGYGLLNLYDDGTFDHAYTTYGWKAES
jgi:3',5'-cyclic AMP phosphodiesterase CpdA